jgi:hypothetical protein
MERVYVMTAAIPGQNVIAGAALFADDQQAMEWAAQGVRTALTTMEGITDDTVVNLVLAQLSDDQVIAFLAQIILLRGDLFDQVQSLVIANTSEE